MNRYRSLIIKSSPQNLLSYPFADTTKTTEGITFTDNEDGTITANGTAINRATFLITNTIINSIDKTKTYVLSGGIDSNCYILMDFYEGTKWKKLIQATSSAKTIDFSTITTAYDRIYVFCVVLAEQTAENVVFKPWLELIPMA